MNKIAIFSMVLIGLIGCGKVEPKRSEVKIPPCTIEPLMWKNTHVKNLIFKNITKCENANKSGKCSAMRNVKVCG